MIAFSAPSRSKRQRKTSIETAITDMTKTDRQPLVCQSPMLTFDRLSITPQLSERQPSPKILVNNASGQLHSGQLTVLTGASGSGKSVLLKALAGLSPIHSGEVYYDSGADRIQHTGHAAHAPHPTPSPYLRTHSPTRQPLSSTTPTHWRAKVALLAQHPILIEGSALDNLKLPYRLQAHQKQRFDISWHQQQLARLGRDASLLTQTAAQLSGGERQLINTLRLLQLDPCVLLLDEPTAALDGDTAQQLIALLLYWLHESPQRTLLWVTHDTRSILPQADQHWQMRAGVLTNISDE